MDIDLENTREAIALLMAAAAQIEDVSAPEPESEPAGDINDLIERQKQLQEQLAVLKRRESELMREMQSIRDEVAAVERQQSSIKERAAAQFEILFGKVERQTPRVQTPTPSVAKPEVPRVVEPAGGASDYTRIPSLSL